MGKPTKQEVANTDRGEREFVPSIELAIEKALEGKVQRRDLPVVVKQLTNIAVGEQFVGPMPHPKHLREYEDILPGAAERIMSMAEENSAHMKKMDEDSLEAEVDDRKRGMRFGAGLFGLLIVLAFASLFVTDSEIVPGLFLGAATIGGITAFVKGRTNGG
jgi:uncharacterized membrane protein